MKRRKGHGESARFASLPGQCSGPGDGQRKTCVKNATKKNTYIKTSLKSNNNRNYSTKIWTKSWVINKNNNNKVEA